MIPLSLVLHVALPVVITVEVEEEVGVAGVMVVVAVVGVSLLMETEAAKVVAVELWLREVVRLL